MTGVQTCALPIYGDIHIIRPLIMVHDKELEEYCSHMGFPDEVSLCPHEDKTNRGEVRELMQMADKLNRSARENIFRSMGTIHLDYIVNKVEKKKPSKK